MFHTAYPIDKASEHDVKNRVNFAHTVLDCIRETGETENIFAFLLWSSVVGVGSSQPTTFFFAVWCAAAITPSSLPPSFLPATSISFPLPKKTSSLSRNYSPTAIFAKRERGKGEERKKHSGLVGGEELQENLYHSENERERRICKIYPFLRKQTGWLVVTQQQRGYLQKSSSNQMRRNFVLGNRARTLFLCLLSAFDA